MKWLYIITHSLFIPLLLLLFSKILALSYLIHLIIDIPFHTSSLRWRPFLFSRYKNKKKALLLSGGMDSIACGVLEKDYDLFYFNYNQIYHIEEYPHALKFAKKMNKKLNIINKEWGTDKKNRNYLMVGELKLLGYNEIIIGTRNILPIFDKYKDSNWLNLKIVSIFMGVYINMPLIGLFKYQIKKIVKDNTFFSTENYFNKKNKI